MGGMLGALVGSFAPVASSFESIATATGTGSSGTITFSSIAGTYNALQIRVNMIGSVASSTSLNFNSDTAANYSFHGIFGTGTAATFNGSPSTSNIQTIGQNAATITTYPNVVIIDVYDYASTSKYKTVRAIGGFNKNAVGDEMSLTSGSWRSTSAVTSITFAMSTGVFNTGTTIALYGVK